jgi:uncharacterized UPF0160 family protein
MLLKHPEAEVIRSRDPEVHASADYVLDTGMIYDPAKNRFDHHMPEGAGVRENGIPYASSGLVWKEFGEELAGGKREAEIIDTKLIQPLDAHDNGVAIAEYKFQGIREYTIGDFLFSFLSDSDSDGKRLYDIFMGNVGRAKELLIREITRAKEVAKGEIAVRAAYDRSEDKRLIELPTEELPWRQVLGALPEPLYIVYQRRDKHWGIKAVPDFTKPYGHNRKDLPESWSGKTNEELQKATGVPDTLFAHRGLFMAAAKTREGVLALAQKALNA